MTEGYSEVRDFWDDVNKAYFEWASENIQFACCPTQNEIYEYFFGYQELIQEYCSMHFHAQNCTQCEDLCVIQNIEPCLKIWTGLSKECCQTCDLFPVHCEVEECNDTTAQITTAQTTTAQTTTAQTTNAQNPQLFYVLVTMLPICGFIGRGSY